MRKHTTMGHRHWQGKGDEAHSKHTFSSGGNLGNKLSSWSSVLILSLKSESDLISVDQVIRSLGLGLDHRSCRLL